MSDPIDELYAAPLAESQASREDALGWLLLALPVCGGVAVGLTTGTSLARYVGLGMLIGTAILAHVDAKRWRIQSPAIGIVLLFVLIYPMHFREREKRGAKLGLWWGLAAELAALVIVFATRRLRG